MAPRRTPARLAGGQGRKAKGGDEDVKDRGRVQEVRLAPARWAGAAAKAGEVTVEAELLSTPEGALAEVKRNYRGSARDFSRERVRVTETVGPDGRRRLSLTAKA